MERIRKYILRTSSSIFHLITLLILLVAVGCIKVEPNKPIKGVPIACGSTQQFKATVIGLQDKEVSWSIDEGDECGTISSGGLYIAPNVLPSPPTATVRATSVKNSIISGTAAVTLTDSVPDTRVGEYFDSLLNWNEFCPPVASSEDQELIPEDECDGVCSNEDEDCVPEAGYCCACEEEVSATEEVYSCTTRQYTLTNTPKDIVMLSPDADLLWPGAIIQGKSHKVEVGSLDGLTIDPQYRAPTTVVVLGVTVAGGNSRIVENPSLSTVGNAINDIIYEATLDDVQDRGDMDFKMEEYYSEESFALKASVSAKYLGFKAKIGTEIETASNEHTVGVTLWEKMFTVTIEPPPTGKPEAFFNEGFTFDMLEDLIAGGVIDKDTNIPLYLSSVVYGRVMMFTLTSTESYTDIQATLNASYSGIASGSVDLTNEQQQLLQSASIKITSIGGPKEASEAIIKSGNWRDFFTVEAQLSTAAPLVYTFKTLSDYPVVATVAEATTYNVRECGARPVILEDFETGSGKWMGQHGHIQWVDCDEVDPGGRCNCTGCEERGNFIYWYADADSYYASYQAPSSFTNQLSGDYVGGYLEYWISPKNLGGSWALGSSWEVYIRGGNDVELFFEAADSCDEGTYKEINICSDPEPYWQKVSIKLSDDGWRFPHCLYGRGATWCAGDEDIRGVLNDIADFRIRAEYFDGGDISFLDDVKITPPLSQ
jgi:hypothetical protein